MILKRNKNFSRLSYSGLNNSAREILKTSRNIAAKELNIKRIKLHGIKDKGLKEALRETYLQGAKYKAEVGRKAAEIIQKT